MVRIVEVEFSIDEMWDISAAAIAARIRPRTPGGISALISIRYAESGRARFGNILYAMIPGSTKSAGVTTCRNPALTTPTRACHSFLAARQRCTRCWLVQLYQMPTLRKLVKTPVNGNSSWRALRSEERRVGK